MIKIYTTTVKMSSVGKKTSMFVMDEKTKLILKQISSAIDVTDAWKYFDSISIDFTKDERRK